MRQRFLTLLFLGILFSCKSSDDYLFIEPAGAAKYFINNKTETDLGVRFKTSIELGAKDSTSTISKNQSMLIFTDGIIGVNPKPTNTFSEIKFFSLNQEIDAVLLEYSPVSDADWRIVEQDLGQTGYGLTKYELVVEVEDLIKN